MKDSFTAKLLRHFEQADPDEYARAIAQAQDRTDERQRMRWLTADVVDAAIVRTMRVKAVQFAYASRHPDTDPLGGDWPFGGDDIARTERHANGVLWGRRTT